MTAKEVIGNGKLLHLLIAISIVAGGFVTYRVWPLRERVSLAEQDIEAICIRQDDIKKEVEARPRTTELTPVLEGIQRQLDDHQKSYEDINKQMIEIGKLMARIEAKME